MGRFLANPKALAIGTTAAASYTLGNYLNNRFGLSQKAADFFAPDNIDYLEKGRKDQALIEQGLNPNEPIYDSAGRNKGREIVGYKTLDETLMPPPEMLANPEATTRPEVFDAAFERDGKILGIKAGDRYKDAVEMSDDQIAQMNKDMQMSNAPLISATPAEGLRQFIDQQGNVMYGNDAAINTGYTIDGAGTTKDFQPIKQKIPLHDP